MSYRRCYYFLSYSCWTAPWVSLPCHCYYICRSAAARSPSQRLLSLGIWGAYVPDPVQTPTVLLCVYPAFGWHSAARTLRATKFLCWEPAGEHLNNAFLVAAMVDFTLSQKIISIYIMHLNKWYMHVYDIQYLFCLSFLLRGKYLFAAEATGGLERGHEIPPLIYWKAIFSWQQTNRNPNEEYILPPCPPPKKEEYHCFLPLYSNSSFTPKMITAFCIVLFMHMHSQRQELWSSKYHISTSGNRWTVTQRHRALVKVFFV